MNFCAIICEFNPFHNGHKYILEKARALSGCDGVLCIMSGNFTQRGECCISDKYTRARHAILGGADAVIQLPSPFAVAPAEVFASGAIKILSAIPDVTALAFGCTDIDKKNILKSAALLIDEPERFKNVLYERLDGGESYIRSYGAAFESCGGDKSLLSEANNILALEYAKALIRKKSDIEILPIRRIGSTYGDCTLKENYSSASAIRQNILCDVVKGNVPEFVYRDLKISSIDGEFKRFLRHCLFNAQTADLKRVYGCCEGLENKLKALDCNEFDDIVKNATSKRYSSSRIRRILCANALKLYSDDCEKFLNTELYIKPLAVKKERADEILSALAKSDFPIVTDAYGKNLNSVAAECFKKDCYEFALYNHLSFSCGKDYMTIV